MSEHFDFAIAGSTPLSALLAGVLARKHDAKVCWIGSFRHTLRPQGGFDISAAPLTRPETWRLLQDVIPQTLKILGEIGDGRAFERVDPLMVASTQAGADALSHMRNVAQEYGFQIERQAISTVFSASYQFRDAVRVLRRPLMAAIPEWLQACGVVSLSADHVTLRPYKRGDVRLGWDGNKATADRLILAGDRAILRHGQPDEVARHFQQVPITALLTAPTGPLETSVVQMIDSGLTLYQRNTGALDCVGTGSAEDIAQAACVHLKDGDISLAGKARYITLRAHDGGAVFGGTRDNGIIYLAGFGVTGLFQLPALARILSQSATSLENTYFAARAPSRSGLRPAVAEFISGRQEAVAS